MIAQAQVGKTTYQLLEHGSPGYVTVRRINADGEKDFHFPIELVNEFVAQRFANAERERVLGILARRPG